MLIDTSGDGVVGMFEYNVNSYDCDTNAEHEYLSLILYIMERSDYDVKDGT